jgi:two-component system, OmpR family, response regulator
MRRGAEYAVSIDAITTHLTQHREEQVIGLFLPDTTIRSKISAHLATAGYDIAPLPHPAHSIRPWSAELPELFIVDVFSSLQAPEFLARDVRHLAGSRPVMVMTPKEDIAMRVLALQNGADDVVAHDIHPEEFIARIEGLLRRQRARAGILRYDDLMIDMDERRVARSGSAIAMPNREYELLLELARSPNRVVPRSILLRSLWRINFDPGTNRIEVHMSRLRSRVDHGFAWPFLHTVKGIGYCLRTRPSDHNSNIR